MSFTTLETVREQLMDYKNSVPGNDPKLDGKKWDVIHFNFGLHDLKHVKVAGTSENSNDFNVITS